EWSVILRSTPSVQQRGGDRCPGGIAFTACRNRQPGICLAHVIERQVADRQRHPAIALLPDEDDLRKTDGGGDLACEWQGEVAARHADGQAIARRLPGSKPGAEG